MEVGRRGLLFGGVFYSFSLLVEWGSFIRGGRLFGRLEYVFMSSISLDLIYLSKPGTGQLGRDSD